MAAERERWSSRTGFVLAAIGSAVGLGNVWRFPYACYENGGGAFLIPYFVALVTAGIPLMILEYGIGQKVARGAPQVFHSIRKRFEWVGWSALVMSTFVAFYYAIIMSWCFVYFFKAFQLGWGSDTGAYFHQEFLRLSSGPLDINSIQWPIFLGLFLTWLSIYLIIVKGVNAVGKVVLITVPLPVILLGIFVIRGLTLPGAIEGIRFYLTPNFRALLDAKVWIAAYSQIFYSLSVAFGVLIAYASYLPDDSDTANNAMITSFANCSISFFAGFAVFSALGFLAQASGVKVADVVSQSIGLAFVTYPTIINKLPVAAACFGVIFFLMLLTLGIDSAFSLVEGIVAGIADEWKLNKSMVIGFTCLVGFGGGIIFATDAGLYWLDIVDHFVLSYGLPVVGILECLLVGYFFNAKRLRDHVNRRSEIHVGWWWDFCIKILTPLLLGIMLVTNLVQGFREPYGGYPQRALLLGGWTVIIITFIGGYLLMRFSRTGQEE